MPNEYHIYFISLNHTSEWQSIIKKKPAFCGLNYEVNFNYLITEVSFLNKSSTIGEAIKMVE